MKNHTYECIEHPDKEMIPAYNYLGLIDYVCPVCRKVAALVKREMDKMHYWQNGDDGRICACLNKLAGNWQEIQYEAYCKISEEMRKQDIKPKDEILFQDGEPCHHFGCRAHISHPCEGCGRIAARGIKYKNPFLDDVVGYNQKLGYRKIKLVRDGFQTLMIRDKLGYWQILEYTDRYGHERWSNKVDTAKFNVEEHIKLYGHNA